MSHTDARYRFEEISPKTGAAGAFMNKINMTNKHGKSNAATPNDDAHSSNKSDKVIENEAEI